MGHAGNGLQKTENAVHGNGILWVWCSFQVLGMVHLMGAHLEHVKYCDRDTLVVIYPGNAVSYIMVHCNDCTQ